VVRGIGISVSSLSAHMGRILRWVDSSRLSHLALKRLKSAVMAGLKVVPVKSLPDGSLDIADLRTKAEQHKDDLAAFMVSIASGNDIPGLISSPRLHTHPPTVCSRTALRRRAILSTQMVDKSTSTERI